MAQIDPDRPSRPQGHRRGPVGAHRAAPRRPHHQRDASTASCAPTPASTSPTSTRAGPPCSPRTATGRPDGSATACGPSLGVEVAVIVSDTFGRPWRRGLTDVAIGCAGIHAVVDLRGTEDSRGRELQVTEVCVVDELAAAAELVMGKATGVAAAVVRGVDPAWLGRGEVPAEIVRPPAGGPLPLAPRPSAAEPAEDLRDARGQVGPGLPAEVERGPAGVERAPGQLAGPGRRVDGGGRRRPAAAAIAA